MPSRVKSYLNGFTISTFGQQNKSQLAAVVGVGKERLVKGDTMADVEQPLAHLQVLLVEDEPDIAELLLLILRNAGAEVRLVTSAETALSLLEHYHPDVLISNVRLPEKNGDWLIRQVHAQQSQEDLPAIAITSYSREVSQVKLLQSGFHCFMPKPLEPDDLIATVLHLTEGSSVST